MATIINNPGEPAVDTGSGAGVVLGILLTILIVVLLLIFGVPYLRSHGGATQPTSGVSGSINVQVPTSGTPGQ